MTSSLTAAVVARVAAREGRDPTALPPLYESIDPDAVAAVLESAADARVRFEYAGYRVVATSDSLEVIDDAA